MSSKALRRAVLCACATAFSLSLYGADITYSATDQPVSARPALAALVREVLSENPGAQAAQAALQAARARQSAASRPLYNPELALDLEKAETDTGALGLFQTIDWANKRGARADVASFERVATRAQVAAVRQELAGELLSALARFQTAKALAQLAQQRTDLMRRFSAVSEQRSRAGDLNQVDLEVARLAYAQARLERAQAVSAVIAAHQDLTAVVGDLNRSWPSLPAELPGGARDVPDLDALLNDLPILRLQRAEIAAARSLVELNVRQRRPDPTIGLRGGAEESEPLVGLNLSIPLFVRNTFSAEVDAANADLIQAQQQAQDIYRRTRARLVSALKQYRVTQSARRTWEQSGQESLNMQLDLLRRLWQAGEISTADFLVQLNQALSTQVSAIELHGQAWQAWFEWLVASGQIDTWLGLRRL